MKNLFQLTASEVLVCGWLSSLFCACGKAVNHVGEGCGEKLPLSQWWGSRERGQRPTPGETWPSSRPAKSKGSKPSLLSKALGLTGSPSWDNRRPAKIHNHCPGQAPWYLLCHQRRPEAREVAYVRVCLSV